MKSPKWVKLNDDTFIFGSVLEPGDEQKNSDCCRKEREHTSDGTYCFEHDCITWG